MGLWTEPRGGPKGVSLGEAKTIFCDGGIIYMRECVLAAKKARVFRWSRGECKPAAPAAG